MATSDVTLPEPLTPADCDLTDFAFMPLDVRRLLSSETWVLGTGDERAAAMCLWLESWHQVPAGSLPDNDRMLAHLAQCLKWAKVREHALRGWVKCADGRLYHPVVAEKALEAWVEKLLNSLSGATGNAKRWGVDVDLETPRRQIIDAIEPLRKLAPQSRTLKKKAVAIIVAGSPPDSPPESPEDRKGQGQGQGQGQGLKEQEPLVSSGDETGDAGEDSGNAGEDPAGPEDGYTEDFERFWSVYPRRHTSSPKKPAWKAWNARLRAGVSAADLIRAAERYAQQQAREGKVGTAFVKLPATFIGPDEHWRELLAEDYAPAAQVQGKTYPFVPQRGYQLESHEFWHPVLTDTVLSVHTHHPATLERRSTGGASC